MPDCVMRIFERCGHKPPSEHPGEFSEAVLAFLG
jgi:pimeloyl-ACP methyl ester carboxylesterase